MEAEILTKGSMLIRGIFALIIGIPYFFLPIGVEAVIAYIIGIFLLIISPVFGIINIITGLLMKNGDLIIA